MNIKRLPVYKLTDIPACLRMLADKIEAGEDSAARVVVIIEDDEGVPDCRVFGEEPFTIAHAIGLCFVAASNIGSS